MPNTRAPCSEAIKFLRENPPPDLDAVQAEKKRLEYEEQLQASMSQCVAPPCASLPVLVRSSCVCLQACSSHGATACDRNSRTVGGEHKPSHVRSAMWGSQCCRVVVRKRNACIEELTKSGSVFRCVLLRCRVAHQPQLMPGPSQHCGQPSNPAVVNTWQFEDRAC